MRFQSAYKAYQAGRFDEAERDISAHLQQSPTEAQAQQLGALIAMRRFDFGTALDRITRSLANPTNRHEKLNTQGNILTSLGETIAAEDAFKAALIERPDYNPARINLARLLFDVTDYRQATEQFAAAAKTDPASQVAWRGHILSLMESQDLDAARDQVTPSPLSDPEKTFLRAKIAFYAGDSDTALAGLRKVLDDPDQGADALSLALQTLHMTGRWAETDDLVSDLLERHPKQADLWATAARAKFRSGDPDAAHAILKDAPSEFAVHLVKLDMMIAQSKFEDAEALAMQLLRKTPGQASLMKPLCNAALGTGKYDLAQQVADAGLRLDPNDQFYHAIKATAGRAKGQDYKAYFDYERFVRPYDLAAPEGWSDMASFNADLKAALTDLHAFKGAPLDQTLRSGTQTAPNLRFVDHPAIQGFFAAIRPAVLSYLEAIGQDPHHPLLRRNLGDFRVRGAWSVRLGSGGHHVNHIHSRGWISSAYYVDVPERPGKEGWIKFGEPPAPLNAILGQGPEHEVKPIPGRLVLFPSYLWHGTYPITGDATRMTLPIDILPARPG